MRDTADRKHKRKRRRLWFGLESELEPVMFLLALAWLWLFAKELIAGLEPWEEKAGIAIWIAFVVEYLLKLYLAPHRSRYIVSNWITGLALLVPALRAFRLLRAVRVLRATRAVNTTRIVRALTSTRRFYRDMKEAQGVEPEPAMNVGLLVAASPSADIAALEKFALGSSQDVRSELKAASGIPWQFHLVEARRLDSAEARMPSDFLDEASFALAQGGYDLVLVVTDVALTSKRRELQPALVSTTARIGVISLRPLLTSSRGKPIRSPGSRNVVSNGGALILHLVGHIAGLSHSRNSEVMREYVFRESRRSPPGFNEHECAYLKRSAQRLPERELRGRVKLAALLFHVLMALRHPAQLIKPLMRNKALLLPLSLPGLATAAVAPSFLLVFTAEIWDVGLGMSNGVALLYATLSILGASLFLARVQSLFLPRKDRNVLTEHLAVANSVIFLSILLACIGLFFIVAALMLAIEVWIFPADLVQTWPTLDQPEVAFSDKLRLSAFIATIGVTTGALAGGFESRTVIRNLALFEDTV